MFDKDSSGSISTDEIKQVLSYNQNCDEAQIIEMVKQVDANGDGEISFDEFKQMMQGIEINNPAMFEGEPEPEHMKEKTAGQIEAD